MSDRDTPRICSEILKSHVDGLARQVRKASAAIRNLDRLATKMNAENFKFRAGYRGCLALTGAASQLEMAAKILEVEAEFSLADAVRDLEPKD